MPHLFPRDALLLRHLLVLWTLLLFPALGAAQDTRGVAADVAIDAVMAGEAAAKSKGVSGYFLSSFVAGVPTGFLLPIAVATNEPQAVVGVVLGGAALGATISKASTDSAVVGPATSELLRSESHAYQQAFREAYEERLSRRRVAASMWGGAIGTGVGLGALVYVLSQVGDF